MDNEPVRLAAAITAALTASLAVLAVLGVPAELVAALNAALAAVVAVVFELVRNRVDGPRTAVRHREALSDLGPVDARAPQPVG